VNVIIVFDDLYQRSQVTEIAVTGVVQCFSCKVTVVIW
jgi:hypothetical protein